MYPRAISLPLSGVNISIHKPASLGIQEFCFFDIFTFHSHWFSITASWALGLFLLDFLLPFFLCLRLLDLLARARLANALCRSRNNAAKSTSDSRSTSCWLAFVAVFETAGLAILLDTLMDSTCPPVVTLCCLWQFLQKPSLKGFGSKSVHTEYSSGLSAGSPHLAWISTGLGGVPRLSVVGEDTYFALL